MSHVSAPIVLAVDDEPFILRMLDLELSGQGARVLTATNARDALACMAAERPEIALLDVRMPDMDGYRLMQRLREIRPIPVIMISAMDRDLDRTDGLQQGADDYIVKPFNPDEVGARVRAVLRRSAGIEVPTHVARAGEVEVDFDRRLVKRSGSQVCLTRTEWKLLRFLAAAPGRTNLAADILVNVWGEEYRDCAQYLRVWISRLRTKLEADPANPRIILTTVGVGYTFVGSASDEGELQAAPRPLECARM